jgi:hypothetical protein
MLKAQRKHFPNHGTFNHSTIFIILTNLGY